MMPRKLRQKRNFAPRIFPFAQPWVELTRFKNGWMIWRGSAMNFSGTTSSTTRRRSLKPYKLATKFPRLARKLLRRRRRLTNLASKSADLERCGMDAGLSGGKSKVNGANSVAKSSKRVVARFSEFK